MTLTARRAFAPLWAKLTIALGMVLTLAAGSALAAGQVLLHRATSTIVQANLTGGAAKTVAQGADFDNLVGPVDLLLMGVDARERWAEDALHADTIIILHIPASHDRAYLISIPRDTEVTVPAFPRNGYPGGTVKATEAFFWGAQHGGGWTGGAQLLAATLKNMTGISFDGAAIINFGGFKSVIDRLGGVHLCVDQQVVSHHMVYVGGRPMYLAEARRTGRPMKPVVHRVGCRDMAGWKALDYARQRYGLKNGDYDRQRHQQQLVKAMAKKAARTGLLSNPVKIAGLLQAAGRSLVVDTGYVSIADYALSLKKVAANDMVLLRTNDGTFAGNANGREGVTAKSALMYAAVKQDRLDRFILSNPDVVATEK
ncbi:LCP family protein [Actinoplanes sp. NPDC051851]|uniref:LCP family protein n=1 Tax=Actinoplanes sp. NPDC051851 TaxID=3154753 RepID=UPI0034265B35